ncbi:MAG: sulfonate transporter substrate-binding protein [Glaciihabitans sp.]|nr:sulfonate transporter substrate-binding protein [Glaciihabitans sp.]
MKILTTIVIAAATVLLAAGCAGTAAGAPPSGTGPATSVELGYFANVTQAPALVALNKGFFAKQLGTTKLGTEIFNAGPATVEALNSGAIDAAYIGPSPAINSYIKSSGASLRVVSGVAFGGAELVVRAGITTPAQLKGKTLATPQLGNTQDVALRSWLKTQGLSSSLTGGGDVSITPTDNAQTLTLFTSGKIDGAWVPEPWASRLVLSAGAHVLVDEASLWPGGKFSTTDLVVNSAYLKSHRATVAALVKANLDAVDWLNANPKLAASVINAQLTKDAGKPLSDAVIGRALQFVHFSVDPLAGTAQTLNEHAVAAGTGTNGNLKGLFDLSILNAALRASGAASVSSDGLG